MRRVRLKELGIRTRVLLLALLPLFAVGVALGLFAVQARAHGFDHPVWRIVLVTGGAALLAALWLGRGVVRPIQELSQAVEAIGRGDLSTRLPVSAGGELGALKRGFNDMAQAIESSQSRLRDEVRLATARLQQTVDILEARNRELDVARREALAAGEEKINFLANMSHEVRTPINAVLGYAALLERSGLDPEQREYARTISRASNQLLRVIDDILSFSRLEAGGIPLDHANFDLRETLEDIVCLMGPEARNKGLELVLTVDSDVPARLAGDSARIGQIVINLLGNAIKFTERGSVTVRARVLGRTGDEAEIEVRVTDTGIGIDPQAQARIFESFHQADASISRRYGGAGLGLAIVSRLVELWGGRLGVDSVPGEGSTFWFTFSAAIEEESTRFDDTTLAGRKVLVYDDNPAALNAVRNLLLNGAADVFLARRQDRVEPMIEAARADGAPFDLAILGLGLSDHDDGDGGPAALVDLVRREYRLPLLLMVNCHDTALLGRSLSDDGLKIVVKPVRREVLFGHLRNLLDPADAHGAHAPQTPPEHAAIEGFEGLRVLIAEDNDFNRTLIANVLEAGGVAVALAVNGEEAIERMRGADFDAVVMDLHLPGMDGAETARRLRALDPDKARVPIIALTADVFAERRGEGIEEMDAFLTKPLDEGQLWRTLRELCRRECERDPCTPAKRRRRRSSGEIRALLQPQLLGSITWQRGRIATALAVHDFAALREFAHELRGVTGYFGLKDFSQAVTDFERLLADPADPTALERQLERIDACIERVRHMPAAEGPQA